MKTDKVFKLSEGDLQLFRERLADQTWRMNHLYFVRGKDGVMVPFVLNRAQEEFHRGRHKKNVILKARQLGMSTYMAIFALDSCLFQGNFEAGIIDKTLPDASEKVNKARVAWEMMDDVECLRLRWGEKAEVWSYLMHRFKMSVGVMGSDGEVRCDVDTVRTLRWRNGSRIQGDLTFRGGTLNLLHVSEFAYICRHRSIDAEKIKTGAFPAVERGMCVLESTHEGGKFGHNWEIMREAMEVQSSGRALTPMDFKFFFFHWGYDDAYRYESAEAVMTDETEGYFARLENEHGLVFSRDQKLWYEGQRNFYRSSMMQEYPSIPAEAFERIAANAIYGDVIKASKDSGRWGVPFSVDRIKPIVCFWDLGWSDFQVVVFVQFDGERINVFDYVVRNKTDISWFFAEVRNKEVEYGQRVFLHVLPHDATQKSKTEGKDYTGFFNDAGMTQYVVMSRCPNVWTGIQYLRKVFDKIYFHERLKADITVTQYDGGVTQYPTVLESLEQHSTKLTGNGEKEDDTVFSHGADAMRYIGEFLMNGGMERLSGYHGGERFMTLEANPSHYDQGYGAGRMPGVIW